MDLLPHCPPQSGPGIYASAQRQRTVLLLPSCHLVCTGTWHSWDSPMGHVYNTWYTIQPQDGTRLPAKLTKKVYQGFNSSRLHVGYLCHTSVTFTYPEVVLVLIIHTTAVLAQLQHSQKVFCWLHLSSSARVRIFSYPTMAKFQNTRVCCMCLCLFHCLNSAVHIFFIVMLMW